MYSIVEIIELRQTTLQVFDTKLLGNAIRMLLWIAIPDCTRVR